MSIPQVSPRQLAQWCASQSSPITLLDIREPWEVEAAGVAASAELPRGVAVLQMPMNSIPSRMNQLPTSGAMVVMCHHGVRSQHAAVWLHAQGFEGVANLSGGIAAWSRELDAAVATY